MKIQINMEYEDLERLNQPGHYAVVRFKAGTVKANLEWHPKRTDLGIGVVNNPFMEWIWHIVGHSIATSNQYIFNVQVKGKKLTETEQISKRLQEGNLGKNEWCQECNDMFKRTANKLKNGLCKICTKYNHWGR